MSSPRPLTRKQRELLVAFLEYQRETGLSPTLRELGERLEVTRVTVHGHVMALVQKGYLENREPGASRGLELTDAAHAALAPTPVAGALHASGFPQSWHLSLPLLGRIAAGAGIEAVEDREEIRLAELLHVREDTYLLEVHGDSMIGEHIRSGDYVVVERSRPPQPGDLVVAILPGEAATLKRYRPQPDGTTVLEPANPAYEPIVTRELEIRGVVAGVLRRY